MLHYYIAYGLMLLAILLFSLSAKATSHQKARNYCIFFFVLWTLILGLRHPSMGIDIAYGNSYGYWENFSRIADFSLKEAFTKPLQNYEQGYIVFNKILSFFSDDPQLLLFVCAAICIGAVCFLIAKNSDFPFLSSILCLGLPFFLIFFSGLRQTLAISITLFSFPLIKKKKLLWFLLVMLLARTFHQTSSIFILAYPLYHLKMNKSVSTLTILLPPVIFLLRYPLFSFLSQLLKDNAVTDNNNAITLFLVFWAVYFFAVLFGHEEDQTELGLRNIFLIACCCQAFSGVYNIAMRIGYYFMPVLAILLPKVIANNTHTESNPFANRRSGIIMYIVIFVCFAVFGLYSFASSSWAQTNPHSFMWQ